MSDLQIATRAANTGCARPAYDPKLVDMFIARVQHTKEI